MNSKQRILSALEGEKPEQTPVMLHNFMMAARENHVSMKEYRTDPRKIADCFIRSVETYHYDGIVVDIDTATLAGALGVPVDFPEDEPARCIGSKLDDLHEVENLEPVDILHYRPVQVWLESVRLLKDYFQEDVAIRGNCDQCPFSLAGLMRSSASWMMDLMDESLHERAFKLLDYCENVTKQFLKAMSHAGADILSNGDSPAGPDMISPALYRKFAFPYEKKTAEYVHQLGKPYILHICGKTDLILEDMCATGVDGLELDYKTNIQQAHDIFKNRTAFIGNLDPTSVLAYGDQKLVQSKTRELLDIFSDTPRFILNAGCAIPPMTPSENIQIMIQTARSYR